MDSVLIETTKAALAAALSLVMCVGCVGCVGDDGRKAPDPGRELHELFADHEQWVLGGGPETAVFFLGDESRAAENERPFFRKLDYDLYHAHVEGWALYSEGLGYEMGIYTDPYSRVGQLDLDIFRAIRLVVDTGLHSRGWSRERALDYFAENSSLDEDFARTEVDRYLVFPGQAVAYKVGELEFLRLLAERVESYIAEKKRPSRAGSVTLPGVGDGPGLALLPVS